jgi:hypothetical protein
MAPIRIGNSQSLNPGFRMETSYTGKKRARSIQTRLS